MVLVVVTMVVLVLVLVGDNEPCCVVGRHDVRGSAD